MIATRLKSESHAQARRLYRYTSWLAVIWTTILACSFAWQYHQLQREVDEISRTEARAAIDKDILYRRWAASHGGIYLPVTDRTRPNPYLSYLPERDIATPSGKRLTLVNPAYMTRQVFELARERMEAGRGHLTSLNPIRPENAPDPWEGVALRQFELGLTEISGVQLIDGKPFIRLMRPMVTEEPCLKCHAAQGYTIGDIRGGISVSIPIAPIREAMASSVDSAALVHGFLWVVGITGLGLGATNMIRKTLALEESDERFRSTFEQAAVGIAHMAPDGKFIRVNKRLCDIVGYSPEEMPGRTFQEITHPDDVRAGSEKIRLLLEGKNTTSTAEKRCLRKDGSAVWVILTLSLVRDAGGTPEYFINVVEDITERKKLEAQLHQSQKMESIGALAGGVAHDFNNILTVIIGNGSIMQMKMEPASPLLNHLQQMLDAAERAAGLTRGLLSFSRKHVFNLSPVDLNSVVQNLGKLLRMVIGEGVELTVSLAPEKLTVLADIGQLEQVLMNLAVNARDAMPQGGALLIGIDSVTVDEEFAAAAVITPGRYATVIFTDTGGGIAKENVGRIFEPFFTTKEKGKGTGLGLSIVYGIIRQHNGHIKVYSEPAYGTTFKIYLPQTSETAIEGKKLAPCLPRGTETILVAEDEEAVRSIVISILEEFGYKTIAAVDGKDAVQKFREHQESIALVFLDVIMPMKNGRQAYEEIEQIRPGTKVLFTSGYTDDIISKQNILEEWAQIITKPVSHSTLLTRLREILDA